MNTETYTARVAQLTAAAAAYYQGFALLMTDREYDDALAEVVAFEAENPTEAIAHDLFEVAASTGTGDVAHSTPMLSLAKVTDMGDVERFIDGLDGAEVVVEPKLDGLALRVVYLNGVLSQAVTRGDGQAGEDVTARLRRKNVTVAGLPKRAADGEVRGEILMTATDFAASNANRIASGKPGFANPRNATAGTVRAETLDYDVQMTFVAYDAPVQTEGFILAPTLYRGADSAAVLEAVQSFGHLRADYTYPTDGVVIKATDAGVRERLGATSRTPRWAVAYKYEALSGESIIRDILVEVGRTGNLSFTAVFDPVLVDGSTISRASLHNVEQIAAKDIRIGSRATVYKANDIIPQVLSVVNDEGTVPWAPPTEDEDGYPFDTSQTIWRSTNPSAFLSGLIAYAASRDVLDIDGLGREIADALVETNTVSNVADLFGLTESVVSALPLAAGRTVGDKTAAKIVANILGAKAQPLNRVITALGIRLTGRTFGRRLAQHFGSLSALASASIDDLMQVEGVGDGRAQVIYDGLRRNAEVIQALIDAGVTSTMSVPSGTRALDGLTVVVTGAMTGPLSALGRTQVNELIDSHGGRASGSVSKNTGLLVCGEAGSSKWQKATDLGVRIVTPEEFAVMLGM